MEGMLLLTLLAVCLERSSIQVEKRDLRHRVLQELNVTVAVVTEFKL